MGVERFRVALNSMWTPFHPLCFASALIFREREADLESFEEGCIQTRASKCPIHRTLANT